MLLRELGAGVHHLRLHPDPELQALLVCVGGDVVDPLREFAAVDLPVAQTGIRVVARVFVAEPAVIQHEHLQVHRGRIVDHPQQRLRVEIEISTLPAVEQDRMDRAPAVQAVAARPAVQVARSRPGTGTGIGPDHVGGTELLTRGQRPGRGKGMDAADHVEPAFDIVFERQPVIAAPGQGPRHHLTGILLQFFRAETEHEGGVGTLGILRAAAGFEDLHAFAERLGFQFHLLGPGPVDMREEVAVRAQGERAGGILQHPQRLRPFIQDLRMLHDHVFRRISVEDQAHRHLAERIFQQDGGRDRALPAAHRMRIIDQLGVVRPVRVAQVQGRLSQEAPARGRIGLGETGGIAHVPNGYGGELVRRHPGPVIHLIDRLVFADRENETGRRGLHGNHRLRPGMQRHGRSQQRHQESKEKLFHYLTVMIILA